MTESTTDLPTDAPAEDAPTAVRATVTVPLPPAEAFRLFTEDIGEWWHPGHHIIEAPLARMVLEPREGGGLYDVGTDGSECHWSRVLAYEPPHRLVFSWDIDSDWKIETDLTRTSEVEVRFTPEGVGTRVDLEHRHLERHGAGWEDHARAVQSGWQSSGLDRFAAYAAGAGV